jgi:hypothetical protein
MGIFGKGAALSRREKKLGGPEGVGAFTGCTAGMPACRQIPDYAEREDVEARDALQWAGALLGKVKTAARRIRWCNKSMHIILDKFKLVGQSGPRKDELSFRTRRRRMRESMVRRIR